MRAASYRHGKKETPIGILYSIPLRSLVRQSRVAGSVRWARNLGDNKVRNTSFLENQTILRALEFTLNKGGFGASAKQKKTASSLVRTMKSTDSVSGRHEQIMSMLKKGATLEQMMKASGSSRRTVFRYLNHFEDAGADIALGDGRYRLK